ncbi:hypothetical protein CDO52_05170 [Nocardiopsis gilva YIM 90087]|uniref:Uncharacterized protein n=1 Tax=Nocardiopsis gilva YIM 90087 TaxID=1235441 RepID=A0A223S2G0_9ACTN|nr:hypothetical protein [Nocardiopsis gilva]ASU82257.1 hypothetical protein CDO52_05170 [Nocardiopsis gilva YIM 90087]
MSNPYAFPPGSNMDYIVKGEDDAVPQSKLKAVRDYAAQQEKAIWDAHPNGIDGNDSRSLGRVYAFGAIKEALDKAL